jgi:hypothetical protein
VWITQETIDKKRNGKDGGVLIVKVTKKVRLSWMRRGNLVLRGLMLPQRDGSILLLKKLVRVRKRIWERELIWMIP